VGQDLIGRMVSAATEYGAAWSSGWSAIADGEGTEVAALHLRRASGHLVTLLEGLKELHEQLDRPPVLPTLGAYTEADVLRIVRAAVAFRQAAPEHEWPRQPWGEMAELCAAVDRKAGPDGVEGPLPTCPECGHWSRHSASRGCRAELRSARRTTSRCGCKARTDEQGAAA
jgi:hypothetical protein